MKTAKTINSTSDNSNYILYNISNYKPIIDNTSTEILNKFVSIVVEYMQFIVDKITVKNKLHYKFIIEKGVETLLHVFTLIFYYTKNLELTSYHTQKAFYFYIEFIEQISDDNITFLQLSSRDAIMFVYKKTIYDINNEYKKNIGEPSIEEKNILSVVNSFIDIYKIIIQFIINNLDFNYETKNEYINNCSNYLIRISENLNKNKIKKGFVDCTHLFITLLTDNQIEINLFLILLDTFVAKICSKRKYDDRIIKNALYDLDITTIIANNELSNIINLIFIE